MQKKPLSNKRPAAGTGAKKAPVTSQAQLDPNNPIPFEFGGTAFSYVNQQRYIPFLFPKDNFFQTLLEAKTLSVTQTACVETKKTYCAGRGLYDIDNADIPTVITDWFNRINGKGDSALTLSRKAFGSHFTFGNTPIEIVRFSVAGKKKLFIYVHNVLEWRLAWPDDNGNVTQAIYSKLFLRQNVIAADLLKNAVTLPLYNSDTPNAKSNWFEDPKKPGVFRTMIWLKNDMDGYEHYGMPSSIASLMNQVQEYSYTRYDIDNLENNMVIGGILALKGNLSPEEATRIGKQVNKTYTGNGKRGRTLVVSSEEGIDGSAYHQNNLRTDGSFTEAGDKVMTKIIMANEWDPLLAGTANEKAFGKGNTYLRTIYEIKKKTTIDPAKDFLMTNLWNVVFGIASVWFGPSFGIDKLNIGIKDIDPISLLSDVDPSPAITVDEIRAAVGLPPHADPKVGATLLGALTPPKPSPTPGQTDV